MARKKPPRKQDAPPTDAEMDEAELVELVDPQAWLDRAITVLNAHAALTGNRELWNQLLRAMSNPNHRPNEAPQVLKDAIREQVIALEKQGIKQAAAILMVRDDWNARIKKINADKLTSTNISGEVTEGQIKRIRHQPSLAKRQKSKQKFR